MYNTTPLSLEDHEVRIKKLEDSNAEIKKSLSNLNTALEVNEAKSSQRMNMMMSQNQSLFSQNDKLFDRLNGIYKSVEKSREDSEKRKQETLAKVLTYVFGGGGLLTMAFELIKIAMSN